MGSHRPVPYSPGRREPYDGSRPLNQASLNPGGAPPTGRGGGESGGWHVFNPALPQFANREKPAKQKRGGDAPPAASQEDFNTELAADQSPAGDNSTADPGELLAPAGFDYSGLGHKVPAQTPQERDRRWMLKFLARLAAVAGVIAIAQSDLPYLVGMGRKRRRRDPNDSEPPQTPQA